MDVSSFVLIRSSVEGYERQGLAVLSRSICDLLYPLSENRDPCLFVKRMLTTSGLFCQWICVIVLAPARLLDCFSVVFMRNDLIGDVCAVSCAK